MNQTAALMTEAAFEALENGRPFSCIETRQVRYFGNDKKVIKMLVLQNIAALEACL